MSNRYAEGTKVPAERSRMEIMSILRKHGAERTGFMSGPEGDQVAFVLHGRPYRLSILRPTEEEAIGDRAFTHHGVDYIEKEVMRRWRATVLLLKAKLEFAEGDDVAVQRELMPYLLTAGGATLGELVERGAVEQAVGVPLLEATA